MKNDYEKMIDTIEEYIDDLAIAEDTDVFDFAAEDLNYDTMKRLVVLKIIELYDNLVSDKDLTEKDRHVTLISTMAYLSMQNFVLNYKILSHKNDK